MNRMPAFIDNRFGRYPRTTAEAFGLSPAEATPIQRFREPFGAKLVRAASRLCLIGVLLVGGCALLTGCDDLAITAGVTADVSDAQAQARAEWRAQAHAGVMP